MQRVSNRVLIEGEENNVLPLESTAPSFLDRLESANWFHATVVFFVLLTIYLLTMPLKVGLADSGLFLGASYFYGVAHPPGYPLHTILGHLAALIPFGGVPFRIQIVSAVFAAATCSVLWLICRRLNFGMVSTYAAALLFGVSAVFWSQAIIPEVYSLNTFFFFLLLSLTLAYREGGMPKLALWSALVFSLSLANHWPLMVLASPCFLIVVWPRRVELVRALPKLAGLFAVGLTPYLSLFLRSQADPVFNFYGPIRTLRMFWFFVSRRGYSVAGGSYSGDLADGLHFVAFTTGEIISQFTIVGCAVVVIGIWQLKRRSSTALFWALVWAFLSNSYLLLPLLRMRFDLMTQASFRVIPLVSYGVLALALAAGFDWILTAVAGKRVLAAGVGALCFLLVGGVFFYHFRINHRTDYSYADDVARTMLQTVEDRAVIIVAGDADTLPLGYLHHVEGVRPDVTIYSYDAVVFNNRLFAFPFSERMRAEKWEEFFQRNSRPVYTMGGLFEDRVHWDYGLYRQLRSPGGEDSMPPFPDRLLDLIDRVISLNPSDAQIIRARNRKLFLFAVALNRFALASGDEQERQSVLPYIQRLDRLFHGKLGKATAGFDIWEPDKLMRLMDERQVLSDGTLGNWERAHFYYLRGHLHRANGSGDQALLDWQMSASFDPNPMSNRSMEFILRFHYLNRNMQEFNRFRVLYFPDELPPSLQDLEMDWQQ